MPIRRTRAFTLVELLTVIAIIGILAAILLPTIRGARNSADKAKTRAQFSAWASGFEQFRQEYGSYPQFATTGAQKLVNPPGASTAVTGAHLFHDVLAGTLRNGAQLPAQTAGNPPPAAAQNTRRIRFVSFSEADFVTDADVSAGRATTAQRNLIRNAFYGTSMAVLTDTNLDGVINGRDTSGGYPAVTPPGVTTPSIRPTGTGQSTTNTGLTTATTGGVRAGVIFYCAPPGATTENDLLMSWR